MAGGPAEPGLAPDRSRSASRCNGPPPALESRLAPLKRCSLPLYPAMGQMRWTFRGRRSEKRMMTEERWKDLTQEGLELVQQLHALCREQRRHVEQDPTAGLIGILARKQTLAEKLCRLLSQLRAPTEPHDRPKAPGERSGDARGRESWVREMDQALKGVIEADGEDMRRLAARRAGTMEEIRDRSDEARARAAYERPRARTVRLESLG